VVGPVAFTALLIAAYDPVIDEALDPKGGMAIGLGVQRLQDEFGLLLSIATPRFLDDHLAIAVAGGIGWYPDLRALPMDAEDQDFGAWSLYGHARITLEVSARIAPISGRVYAAVGPSGLLLSERLSTTRIAIGIYGAVGAEIFAGDATRSYPFALFLEIGGCAHGASADVASRTGPITDTGTTVDRPIGTGLALSGGVRAYLW
jgi:hypothetical protein